MWQKETDGRGRTGGHTHTHTHALYVKKEIPKAPYVYRHLLTQVKGLSSFSCNCYKLSRLTSLPSTAGLQQGAAIPQL